LSEIQIKIFGQNLKIMKTIRNLRELREFCGSALSLRDSRLALTRKGILVVMADPNELYIILKLFKSYLRIFVSPVPLLGF
jgi:hypothetical protein